ncbi:MAG: glutamate 2,3-aminomutase [Desulfurispora sp.]|uniref:glutamate 2,3-aminomutase n=1 Tax=Desulfurispora sp. TaxID=3014275 RepID=UPI00404B4ADA
MQYLSQTCPDETHKIRVARERAAELKGAIADYLEARPGIPTGLELEEKYLAAKNRIMVYFQATAQDWQDWHWQMGRRISNVEQLADLVELSEQEKADIAAVGGQFRWAVSPYYLAVSLACGKHGALWKQSIPAREEITDRRGVLDPMAEEFTSPAPGITRRYPDRLIINVTNQCAMYCRHCQRRRNIGEVDRHRPRRVLEQALQYVAENPEIRDVLITGGDALLLPDSTIEWLLSRLHSIPHVEIKRLGTRTPVTLPQRITPRLCAILKKYPPIYINTQFNHPAEVTAEARAACDRLVEAGVVLGNQAVLLKGVNNHPFVMRRLNQALLTIRVRPYYIFHAKPVQGTHHFITSIDEGLEIMEKLRGYTSGLAVPTYIINAPNGYGKTPLLPAYVQERRENKIVLRTWEKRIIPYHVLM